MAVFSEGASGGNSWALPPAAPEMSETELQRLVAEVLEAAEGNAELALQGIYGNARCGPGRHDERSHYADPWMMASTFHGPHRNIVMGEAVAFTPARRADSPPPSRGQAERRYSVATLNGEPQTEAHYMFWPGFRGENLLPTQWPDHAAAFYRITVAESLAQNIRHGGPLVARGILDGLVRTWARYDNAARYANTWEEDPGSPRPPYSGLPPDWQMHVLDIGDRDPAAVAQEVGAKGRFAAFAAVYDITSIPAGPEQMPRLPKAT
jgi:hypothetical protein